MPWMWQNLEKYLQERRVSVSEYFENYAVGNRLCSRKNGRNFETDQTNHANNLALHDRLIPNPFFPKTMNNFNFSHCSPLFGLYNIFNHLIYQSTVYIAAAMCLHPPSRLPLHSVLPEVRYLSLHLYPQE